MEHTLAVGSRQTSRNSSGDVHRLLHFEWLFTDQAAKRLAAHQLHDDEGHTVLLAYVVDRGDIGVIERRCQPRLLMESRASLRILRQLWRQHLQGDIPIESRVGRLIHHTHPALADLLDQAVVKKSLSSLDTHLAVLTGRPYGRVIFSLLATEVRADSTVLSGASGVH